MGRVCSVCTHPNRVEIDKALVAGESNRAISRRFRVSKDAVLRHAAEHLPATLVKAAEARENAHALDVMAELQRVFQRANMLFDACDTWLRDPEEPGRYTLEPRAEDVKVIYLEANGAGKPIRKKAPLSRLLAKIEDAGVDVERGEWRHADPRELILKTAERLQDLLQLVAKLIGDLDDRPTVNVVLSPEWQATRGVLLEALLPFPEARASVAGALLKLEAGDGRGN